MNKLESLKSLYKPYRYTIKGKCTILETTSGNFVVKNKPKNKDLNSIFSYLKSRGFNNFPECYGNFNRNDDSMVYEYIEDNEVINPNKSEDLINLIALMHSKTSYNKETREETYREIYEKIDDNIIYLKDYYLKYYDLFLKKIYPSPSEYEFLRVYSKINAALDFSKRELDDWYSLVKSSNSERVALIHNNLSLDHFLVNDNREYLISWDEATFDTPILDLFKLYQNNYWDLEFSSLYQKYTMISPLTKEEEKLFFILISLVPEIKFEGSEFEKCKEMRNKIDYVFKTEVFLKPFFEDKSN